MRLLENAVMKNHLNAFKLSNNTKMYFLRFYVINFPATFRVTSRKHFASNASVHIHSEFFVSLLFVSYLSYRTEKHNVIICARLQKKRERKTFFFCCVFDPTEQFTVSNRGKKKVFGRPSYVITKYIWEIKFEMIDYCPDLLNNVQSRLRKVWKSLADHRLHANEEWFRDFESNWNCFVQFFELASVSIFTFCLK